ncbi:MAG: hypothetical protein HYR55_15630 [Acidobacteria bacterium]|nr:hypothetical protein [Acidobacteriota bacterium]MBI3655972.1 hypothetical protein [Acidobacteriota bacterium]
MTALLLGLILVALLSLGADLGRVWVVRNQLQNAVDSEALAAASALWLKEGTGTAMIKQAETRATKTAAKNRYDIIKRTTTLTQGTVMFSRQSDAGFSTTYNAQDTRFVRVKQEFPIPTYFAGIIGFSKIDVGAIAVAGFSSRRVSRIPLNTTPIVPLGVLVGEPTQWGMTCASFTGDLVFPPPPFTDPSSRSRPLVILDFEIGRSGRPPRELGQYIENGYLGPEDERVDRVIKVGALFSKGITFSSGELHGKMNARFDRDDDKTNPSYSLYNAALLSDGESRLGNGKRVLILPIVLVDGSNYRVDSFATFFMTGKSSGSSVPVQLICNSAIPNGELGDPCSPGHPYPQVTRLQLQR